MEFERATGAGDFSDGGVCGFDAVVFLLLFEFDDQVLLDCGLEVHVSGGFHIRGIGVDRFFSREVADCGEGLGGFEDFEIDVRLRCFDRRGHACDASADNSQIECVAAFLEILFIEDGLDSFRAGVGGEFQERNPGEVSDNADSGDITGAVVVDVGGLFDSAGGPFSVKPVGVIPNR